MKLLNVHTIEETREKLYKSVKEWELQTHRVPLFEAMGFTLAENIYASEDMPAFNRSTVDGYALRGADTRGAGESNPVYLTLIGEIEMGQAAQQPIGPGECVYVPTGGMLPPGADAVAMVEFCDTFGINGITVGEAISYGRNVAFAGEDAKNTQLILAKNTLIRPVEIGVLAAAGIINPLVYQPLKMSIISTGDELTSPCQSPPLGKVRDINTYLISALAIKKGYNVIETCVLPDNKQLLKDKIAKAMEISDIVVISGGSSKGQKDYTANIIDELASPGVLTHGMAIKPGKPTITGYDELGKTLLIGLPGHPVSAMMVFEVLLGWLWYRLTGSDKEISINAQIDRNIFASPGKDTLQMVKLFQNNQSYTAQAVYGKSGDIIHLAEADGYIIIDRNTEGLKAGEAVTVYLF